MNSFFLFENLTFFEIRTAISLCGAEVACVMACLSMLAGMEHNLILTQNIAPDRREIDEEEIKRLKIWRVWFCHNVILIAVGVWC